MGQVISQYKKDDHVDIYLETSKPFYMAGQQVQGTVYINVHSDSHYDALYVKLCGKEYCHWTQKRKKRTHHFSASKQTYNDEFILQKFGGTIFNGQYAFPFAFVLPTSMSGSFYLSSDNYISYPLTAYLTCSSKKNDNQPFTMNLNIRELPKVPKGVIKIENIIQGKCCKCCADYGVTKVAIKCEKNILNTGEQNSVEIVIDNSKGTEKIENVTLTLMNKHVMTACCGKTNYNYSQNYVLNTFANRVVMPGAVQFFKSTPFIPTTIQRETTIGAITANWFQLTVHGQMGCCNYNPPNASLRIFLYSSNLLLSEKQKIEPPKYWNPIVKPLVFKPSMKAFIYQPCLHILNLDLSNQKVYVNTGMQMGTNLNMGIQPSFNQGYTQQCNNNTEGNMHF